MAAHTGPPLSSGLDLFLRELTDVQPARLASSSASPDAAEREKKKKKVFHTRFEPMNAKSNQTKLGYYFSPANGSQIK